MLFNVLQKRDSAGKLHTGDSLSCLAGVLKGNAEERATRLRGLGLIVGSSSVADLLPGIWLLSALQFSTSFSTRTNVPHPPTRILKF